MSAWIFSPQRVGGCGRFWAGSRGTGPPGCSGAVVGVPTSALEFSREVWEGDFPAPPHSFSGEISLCSQEPPCASGCVAIYPWLGRFARVTGRFREVCEPKILTLNGGRKLGSSVYGLYNAALECTKEVIRRLKGATCWMRWSTSAVVVSELILGGENGESQWCYVHGACRRG